jgi:hypothetical protein
MVSTEIIQYSKQNLLFVLMKLNNRGVPIYTVAENYLGFYPKQYKYNIEKNVIDIFDLNWRTMHHTYAIPSGGTDPQYLVDYMWDTYAVTNNYFLLSYTYLSYLGYYGICFYGNQTNTITISASADNINFTIIQQYNTDNYLDGQWIWFDIQQPYFGLFIKISIANGETLSLRAFFTGDINNTSEIPCGKLNRDDMFNYTNKGVSNGSPINYYYYKGTQPQIWFWQSINGIDLFNWNIHYMQYNTINEFINLPNTLQIPDWSLNCIKWGLAAENCFEIPNVSDSLKNMIINKAEQEMSEAECSNSDSSSINTLGDMIACYTR